MSTSTVIYSVYSSYNVETKEPYLFGAQVIYSVYSTCNVKTTGAFFGAPVNYSIIFTMQSFSFCNFWISTITHFR